MKTINIIIGLQVLLPYYKELEGSYISITDNCFAMNRTDLPMREESVKAMWQLGWYQPEPLEIGEYDPERIWIANL